jgi:hypothetical protein
MEFHSVVTNFPIRLSRQVNVLKVILCARNSQRLVPNAIAVTRKVYNTNFVKAKRNLTCSS